MIPSATLQPVLVQLGVALMNLNAEALTEIVSDLGETLASAGRHPLLQESLQPLRTGLFEKSSFIAAAGETIRGLSGLEPLDAPHLTRELAQLRLQWEVLSPPADATLQHSAALFTQGPQLSPKALLAVDDEPVLSRAILRMLHDAFPERLSARDGEEALEIIRARGAEIGAVVTDTDMPQRDGISLTKELKQLYPAMPVLVLSGMSLDRRSPQQQEIVLGSPYVSFLTKPFSSERLTSTLHWLLAASADV